MSPVLCRAGCRVSRFAPPPPWTNQLGLFPCSEASHSNSGVGCRPSSTGTEQLETKLVRFPTLSFYIVEQTRNLGIIFGGNHFLVWFKGKRSWQLSGTELTEPNKSDPPPKKKKKNTDRSLPSPARWGLPFDHLGKHEKIQRPPQMPCSQKGGVSLGFGVSTLPGFVLKTKTSRKAAPKPSAGAWFMLAPVKSAWFKSASKKLEFSRFVPTNLQSSSARPERGEQSSDTDNEKIPPKKHQTNKQTVSVFFLRGLLFNGEDGSDCFLRLGAFLSMSQACPRE